MASNLEHQNTDLVLGAFDTLFKKHDVAGAERFWSPDYVHHSAHAGSGREACSTWSADRPLTSDLSTA